MENYFLFYHRSDTDDRMGHCLKKTFRLYTTKRDLKIKIKKKLKTQLLIFRYKKILKFFVFEVRTLFLIFAIIEKLF